MRCDVGPLGRWARAVVGLLILAAVVDRAGGWVGVFGSSSAGIRPESWLLGLVGFPAVVVLWQWLRARRNPEPMRATGIWGHAINTAAILALLLTPWYAPPLAITYEAALIFYGASMLLAAARSYGGCELTAASNALLNRDDQVGCTFFAPVDLAERRWGTTRTTAST